MKLLYVEKTLAIHGGIERVLIDKLNWFVECGGHEVCLLLADQGQHPIVFPLNLKVECHNLNIMFHQVYRYTGWKRYYTLFKLHRLFRQLMNDQIQSFSPDVIVCTRAEYIYDILQVRRAIPVVYESHNSFLSYKFETYSMLQKLQIMFWYHSLRKIQMIVSLTQSDAVEWKKINPNVKVIPNVVHLNDTGRYSDCLSKSAIFVGRYSYQKDIESLLKIWELVCQRYPDWKLHLFCGFGDQKEILQSAVSQQGTNVVLHQPTNYICEEYVRSSMLLMTSRFEPFGLVLPEAMSCGLPVVSFDCPYGPVDIISEGIDGFLIRNRNIEDFVEKICLLIENSELRIQMGKAGIMSSKRYCADRVMPHWNSLFETLIQVN